MSGSHGTQKTRGKVLIYMHYSSISAHDVRCVYTDVRSGHARVEVADVSSVHRSQPSSRFSQQSDRGGSRAVLVMTSIDFKVVL